MNKMTDIEQQHQSIGDNVGNNKQTNNSSAPTGMSGIQGDVHVNKILVNQARKIG